MRTLWPEGGWDDPPLEIVHFGRQFGFVCPAWTSGQYVFPLAHFLSCMPPDSVESVRNALDSVSSIENQQFDFKQRRDELVQKALSTFDERAIRIIRDREGLSAGGKKTLQQIGRQLGITRERVRQIEARFWKRVDYPDRGNIFRQALMFDIMSEQGRLTVAADSHDARRKRFIAKCAGISWTDVPNTEIAVLGASSNDFAPLMTPQQFPDLIDTDAMAGLLDSQDNFFLSADDLFTVAESVATRRLKPLNKTQRVYAALRSIGRPAHYSEVTKAYNSNFPDDQTSQRNILAMLSRCAAPDLEQYGLVWTGAKGVYALKVWGYERPSKGLFDAVTEIVNERSKETGKPVPLVVITAEVGKYRQVVPPSSLIFATHRNPNLRRVSEDTFVPEGGCDEMREDDKQDDLDRILRAFERRS